MGNESGFESVRAEVTEAKLRHDGSKNYQAEVFFTMGTALGSGRARTMCIRGPYRPDKDAAEDDADQLVKTAERDGIQKVRELATVMKKSRVR